MFVVDRVLNQEGLREGGEGGAVGTGSEDAARPEERGGVVPGQELPGAVRARRPSKETSGGREDDRTGLITTPNITTSESTQVYSSIHSFICTHSPCNNHLMKRFSAI